MLRLLQTPKTSTKAIRRLSCSLTVYSAVLRAATARCFAGKLGVQSDRVLNAVMNDRMVAKGLVLHWATAFFVDFLATEPMDDLVAILRKVCSSVKG